MTEFELIYQIFANQSATASSQMATVDKGIGDDASVISPNHGYKLVSCVDTMVQGRHFSDDWQVVEDLAFAIGYKSVVVNLSDLAAMGATPHHILLAIALPQRLANQAWLSEFAKGLFHACQQYNVQLIGGDTTRHDKLVISITAQGFLSPSTSSKDCSSKPISAIYRDGAKVGDKVYVSGTLGDANYALNHPNTTIGQQLAHRLHMPTPRVALGQALAQQGKATAMIDISDGLVQDLGHICQQSGVSIRLNLESLPYSQPLANLKEIPLDERLLCQLTGGDDYELAFTLPASIDISSIANLKQINNTPITCIGEVVANIPTTDTSNTHQQPILYYNNQPITANNPYPFSQLPNLHGFQHF